MKLGSKKRFEIKDSVDYVRNSIGQPPRLTADEERDLATRARAGDMGARDELIRCNIPLVIKVMDRWAKGSPARIERYLGAGFYGLIYAIDRFDPGRGCKLSTYAFRSIRRMITRAFRDEGTLIRVPVHVHDKICRMAAGKPAGKGRSNPEMLEAARYALEQGAIGRASILEDDPLDSVADPSSIDRDDLPMGITPGDLHAAIDRLPVRHAELIRSRWLAAEASQPRLLDIARREGITKQRIQQIEQQAFAALREILSGASTTQERKEAA